MTPLDLNCASSDGPYQHVAQAVGVAVTLMSVTLVVARYVLKALGSPDVALESDMLLNCIPYLNFFILRSHRRTPFADVRSCN